MTDAEYHEQTDWLAHRLARDGKLNLLCFPYAGGTSLFFNRWRAALPSWVNICPLVFPCRESQSQQPHDIHFSSLADKIAKSLLPQLRDLNFALYGHSMGAWFAHDLALRCCQHGFPPRGLLVSGQRAPQLAYPFCANHEIDDMTLLRLIHSFGLLDAELLSNSSWVGWMLDLLRADLSLCETHPPVAPDIKLSCPLHLFANINDPLMTLDVQLQWRLRTKQNFSLSWHQGGHFFIRTHTGIFLKKLTSVLKKISPYTEK